MALQYRIMKRKNNIKESSDLYIMQTIHTGVINTEKLNELISSESSLTEIDVIAVLHTLGKKIHSCFWSKAK